MMIDDYRDQLLKELGLPPLALKADPSTKGDQYEENRAKILNHFLANSSIKPIHIAVSAMHSINVEKWKEKLYLTGSPINTPKNRSTMFPLSFATTKSAI